MAEKKKQNEPQNSSKPTKHEIKYMITEQNDTISSKFSVKNYPSDRTGLATLLMHASYSIVGMMMHFHVPKQAFLQQISLLWDGVSKDQKSQKQEKNVEAQQSGKKDK